MGFHLLVKALDAVLAASLALNALRLIARTGLEARLVAAITLAVAAAILVRSPVGDTDARAAFAALPSLLLGGVVLSAAGAGPWPPAAVAVAAAGAVLAVAGILALGRSFAVLPAARSVRTGGPYRFVRHPIYVGESLVFLAAATRLGAAGAAASVAMVILLVARILEEERVLARDADWRRLADRVRYRLVPGVW